MIRLICLWFTTSHKVSPVPLALFFIFLLYMENPYPYFNLVTCHVTNSGPEGYIFFGLLS